MNLQGQLAVALGIVDWAITGNQHLIQEAHDHYALPSDAVVRANLQFLYTIRRHDARARLFEAAGLSGREGFAKDLADRCAKPLKNDEIGALAHFLGIHPDRVEPYVKRVNQKLRRAKRSTKETRKEVA